MNESTLEILLENEKEWRRYMIDEIKAIKREQSKQGKHLVALKIRASIWGFISGSIPAIIIIALTVLKLKMV
jgi:hypothetical protein